MDGDERRREQLKEEYDALSPEERRRRIFLEPAYRDDYNEIVQAERIAVVPDYFWRAWVPVLGPVASMLYMRLRQYCYWNPASGEARVECWPKQSTLAREIGVKDRKTIRAALVLLESHGFIERKTTYHLDATGRPHQGSDHYLVYFEIPLVAADAAELLIRQTTPKAESGGALYEGKKSPHRSWAVDKSPYEGKKSSHIAGEKIPTRSITKNNNSNVDNVELHKKLEEEWAPPEVGAPRQKKLETTPEAERLAVEVGDALLTMEGIRSTDEHRSAGFHRVIASRMPETLLRKALMATRDAVDDQRAGRKTLRGGPSAYFAGVVKQLAADEGIELGLKAQVERESPVKGNQAPQKARGPRSGGHGRPEDEKEALEAREAVRALREKWAEE